MPPLLFGYSRRRIPMFSKDFNFLKLYCQERDCFYDYDEKSGTAFNRLKLQLLKILWFSLLIDAKHVGTCGYFVLWCRRAIKAIKSQAVSSLLPYYTQYVL